MTGYESKKKASQGKLAQPAQEPVACIHKGHLYMSHEFMSGIPDGATLLYTTPPQRPWVGLTDEEIQELRKNFATLPAIAAIEAKLKDKNS